MSTDNARSAWSSTHPDVIAWWAEQKKLIIAANEARDAWQAEHPEWKLLVASDRATGISTDSGTNPDPNLWRQGQGRSRQWGWWFPRAEGVRAGREERRALLRRFAGMRIKMLPVPGMPGTMSRANDSGGPMSLLMTHPGATEHDGVVWCYWNFDADAIEDTAKPADPETDGNWSNSAFRPDLWTRRKLSEFHAMREAQTESSKG